MPRPRFVPVLIVVGLLATGALAQEKPATTQPLHPGTIYMVGYSHLDTKWRWTYPTVIASGGASDRRDKLRHRDWPGRWTFNPVTEATMRGLWKLSEGFRNGR